MRYVGILMIKSYLIPLEAWSNIYLLQKILALSDMCFRLYSCNSLCIRTGLNRSASLLCCKYCILANFLIAKTTLHPLFLFFPVLLCLPLWFSLFFSAEKRYVHADCYVILKLCGTTCLDVWSTNLWFLCFYYLIIEKTKSNNWQELMS
jgi:hypothetical protein